MSYSDLTDAEAEPRSSRRERRRRRRRRRRGKRVRSLLAVLLSLAVVGGLAAGAWFGGRGLLSDFLGDLFAPAADYSGPGHGEVEVTIPPGASLRSMGRILVDADVVASQEAFVSAAQEHPEGMSIQPGDYVLRLQMSAEDAVAALVAARSVVVARVTIPEGFRLEQILARVAAETDLTEEELVLAVEQAADLGLPDWADGHTEGFLFPATYDVGPDATPESLVQSMINRFNRAAEDVNLVDTADLSGLTPLEAVIVASIIQREVRRTQDMPNVGEVIFNRLSGACREHGIPEGSLQMDSTVHYALGESGSVFTSDEMREVDSPYNTYQNLGLPPGPISAPGEDALRAALDPSDGQLCYMATVNLETGETRFATTREEHDANIDELRAWCRETESSLCG